MRTSWLESTAIRETLDSCRCLSVLRDTTLILTRFRAALIIAIRPTSRSSCATSSTCSLINCSGLWTSRDSSSMREKMWLTMKVVFVSSTRNCFQQEVWGSCILTRVKPSALKTSLASSRKTIPLRKSFYRRIPRQARLSTWKAASSTQMAIWSINTATLSSTSAPSTQR